MEGALAQACALSQRLHVKGRVEVRLNPGYQISEGAAAPHLGLQDRTEL